MGRGFLFKSMLWLVYWLFLYSISSSCQEEGQDSRIIGWLSFNYGFSASSPMSFGPSYSGTWSYRDIYIKEANSVILEKKNPSGIYLEGAGIFYHHGIFNLGLGGYYDNLKASANLEDKYNVHWIWSDSRGYTENVSHLSDWSSSQNEIGGGVVVGIMPNKMVAIIVQGGIAYINCKIDAEIPMGNAVSWMECPYWWCDQYFDYFFVNTKLNLELKGTKPFFKVGGLLKLHKNIGVLVQLKAVGKVKGSTKYVFPPGSYKTESFGISWPVDPDSAEWLTNEAWKMDQTATNSNVKFLIGAAVIF